MEEENVLVKLQGHAPALIELKRERYWNHDSCRGAYEARFFVLLLNLFKLGKEGLFFSMLMVLTRFDAQTIYIPQLTYKVKYSEEKNSRVRMLARAAD